MAEQVLIVNELKAALKERGLTYASVAKHLHLSTASVKRLFSTGNFSLKRIDRILDLLGLGMYELLEQGQKREAAVNRLSFAQEQEIVADPKMFFITWVTLNRVTVDEIVRDFQFTEREVFKYWAKLDELKVIKLMPDSRAKPLVSRHFSWRPGGPVQRYIHKTLLREFLSSHFSGVREEFFFHGAVLSDAALVELKAVLKQTARQCAEIIERDRAPRERRHGAALVLAMRPWVFSGFGKLERPAKAANRG